MFFYEKEQVLFFLKKNAKTPFWIVLHHVISPFSKLDNNNLYLLWHSKLRVRDVTHLCFIKVLLVSLFHQQSGAWHACAQQAGKSHTRTTSVVSCKICVFPTSSGSIERIYQHNLIWFVIRNSLGGENADAYIRRHKVDRNYQFYRVEEENQQNLHKLFELFLSFVSSPSNFFAVRFDWFKKNVQLIAQVCHSFYFLLYSRFFKGIIKNRFQMGVIVVFSSGI